MKKLLTLILSFVCVGCLSAAIACQNEPEHYEHTWVETDRLDVDGNKVYECSECKEAHAHSYAAAWSSDATHHWHKGICGHNAKKDYATHRFEENGEVCLDCGYDTASEREYQILFYTTTLPDSSGYVNDIGVTYESVSLNGFEVNVAGDMLVKGDRIAFKIHKSVFSEYTDGTTEPKVVAYVGGTSFEDAIEQPILCRDGVYEYTIEDTAVIVVTNVAIRSMSIAGEGTAQNPFTIYTATDWLYFAQFINNKEFYSNMHYNTAYWALGNDIDFEGEELYVIGDNYTYAGASVFCGTFNGNGHTLKNFTISNDVYGMGTYAPYVGLFGAVAQYEGANTVITNLNLENFTVNARVNSGEGEVFLVGGLAGFVSGGTIINCSVNGAKINVTGATQSASLNYNTVYTGGLVGYMQTVNMNTDTVYFASIQYCSVNAELICTDIVNCAGLLVGRTYCSTESIPVYMFNNYTTGTVSGAARTGGAVGILGRYASLQNTYSTATVKANAQVDWRLTEEYAGTIVDDSYAYAGGLVGFAENDAVIANCFAKGTTEAKAVGTNKARTNYLLAGKSAKGYEYYNSPEVILIGNAQQNDTINENYLKNTLGWVEADWVFGDGYPTINQEDATREYGITINIDGADYETVTAKSVYRPMSNWYLGVQFAENEGAIINMYVRKEGTNELTSGYYFDAACTQRIPTCYVPLNPITVYAKYADYSDILGEYYLRGNGLDAKMTLKANASYEFECGAIVIDGEYEFDGETLTFKNGYFSRLASTATQTQAATYYNFWATVTDEGNLLIFDGEELVEVTEEDESFDLYGARFFPIGSELKAIKAENVGGIAGEYVVTTQNGTSNMTLYRDGTGTFDNDTLTYANVDGVIMIVRGNGYEYTAVIESGDLVGLKRGSNMFAVSSSDGFAGTWEKRAGASGTYTFDGRGKWTYSEGNSLGASGEYTIDKSGEQPVMSFTHDGVTYTVVKNGSTLSISESGSSVSVGLYGKNGYAGVWYTASYRNQRYTLTLSGIGSEGYGLLTFVGSGVKYNDLRYVYESGALVAYIADTPYIVMTVRNNVLTAQVYDEEYGDYTTEYTFYLYDDFYGDWVSDIEGLETFKFNGFGAYNVAANVGNVPVNGNVIIGDDVAGVRYTINNDGSASFTYKDVEYTLTYNEFANDITVSYNGNTGKITKADELIDVVFVDGEGVKYTFDGRGNFVGGGTVTVGDKTGSYKIDGANINITLEGQSMVISKTDDGYALTADGNTTALGIDNAFTGSWSAKNGDTLVIGDMTEIVIGGVAIAVEGKYNDEDVTMYFDGSVMYFTVYNATTGEYDTYYLQAISNRIVLSKGSVDDVASQVLFSRQAEI